MEQQTLILLFCDIEKFNYINLNQKHCYSDTIRDLRWDNKFVILNKIKAARQKFSDSCQPVR